MNRPTMLGIKELREQFPGFAKEIEGRMIEKSGLYLIEEDEMAFLGKPCTCKPRLVVPKTTDYQQADRDLNQLRKSDPGWTYGPADPSSPAMTFTFMHRDSENCLRHNSGSCYLSGYAQENDPPSAWHYRWPEQPDSFWPASCDPKDPVSVIDAYVRAVHDVDGTEAWLADNLRWRVLDQPIDGVTAIAEWNEPGEPGGSNPGPTYWFQVDGKWIDEEEMDRPYEDHWKIIEAFEGVEADEG